jgi:hypothetical protein
MARVHRPAAQRRRSATLLAAQHFLAIFWRRHTPPKRGFDVCELTPIDVVKPPIRRTWPAHTSNHPKRSTTYFRLRKCLNVPVGQQRSIE